MKTLQEQLVAAIKSSHTFFKNSTDCLEESDSEFAPQPGMFTTAQQVAHVAQAIEWFVSGAFNPKGFSMDFENAEKQVRQVKSLQLAREWLDRATSTAIETFSTKSETELNSPLPAGPIMGGEPVHHVVASMVDHAAHHRGALTVYARLRSRVPGMPYA